MKRKKTMGIKHKPPDSFSKMTNRRAANRKRYHKNKLKAGELSQPRGADLWVAKEFEKYGALYTIVLPSEQRTYTDEVDLKRQMKIVKRLIRNALAADASKELFVQAMKEHAEDVWNRIGLLSTAEQVTLWKRIKYK